MKDNKLKILVYIGVVWSVLFLITLRVKAPMLEGVEVCVLFAGLAWLAYWTLNVLRATFKKTPPQTEEDSNAPETKPPGQ